MALWASQAWTTSSDAAGEDRLVEGDAEGPQGRLGPVDADDDAPVEGGAAGRLVADHEHGAPGVGDDLHRDGADAGPAEHPVAHRAHHDQGRGAGGVDESLARVAVARGRRHLSAGSTAWARAAAVGEQALGVAS